MTWKKLLPVVVAVTALGTALPAAAGAAGGGAVVRTFSFIAAPNSKTKTVANVDSLLLNARCSASGSPVVYAFSSASSADLLGRVFDGAGRFNLIRDTSFGTASRGVALTPSRNDFDVTGTVLYEAIDGRVVHVTYAADNATTLGKRRVCTVYGSYIAS